VYLNDLGCRRGVTRIIELRTVADIEACKEVGNYQARKNVRFKTRPVRGLNARARKPWKLPAKVDDCAGDPAILVLFDALTFRVAIVRIRNRHSRPAWGPLIAASRRSLGVICKTWGCGSMPVPLTISLLESVAGGRAIPGKRKDPLSACHPLRRRVDGPRP
jgi:hypothetical protein